MYFFEIWDALEASPLKEGRDPQHKAVYFRFLILMSLHVFIEDSVHAAIYEVVVGGPWGSTNVVEVPAVTGITKLGIHHIGFLRDIIDKIAKHKAGSLRAKSSAFTIEQALLASEVL